MSPTVHPAIGVVKTMPVPTRRNFPNFIDAYLEFTKDLEATERIHRWTAIATVAAALERKVWIEHGHFRLYPNQYIMIVGAPGMMKKSTATGIGNKLLKELPKIKFAPQQITSEALVEKLVASRDHFTHNGSEVPFSAVFAYVSELTDFIRAKDEGLINMLTSLYDCSETYVRETISHGKREIVGPCLNLLGCTTPNSINSAITVSQMESGFASRFIFVVEPNIPKKLVAFPKASPDQHFMRQQLIEDLYYINNFSGEVKFTSEALLFHEDWYHDHMNELESYQHTSRFTGYYGRRSIHVEKIATILSVCERDDLVVTEKHVEIAIELLEDLETTMNSGFMKGRNEIATETMRVLHFIKVRGRATDAELRSVFFTDLNDMEYKEVMGSLQQMGQIQQVIIGASGTVYQMKPGATDIQNASKLAAGSVRKRRSKREQEPAEPQS